MVALFASLALIHQLGVVPSTPPPDKVVITANGHAITAKQVQAYLWDWSSRQVAQTLAVYEVIHDEAAKKGIHLSDADVLAGIDAQEQPVLAQMPKGADKSEFLRSRGLIRSQVEFKTRAQLLLKALALLEFNQENFVRVETIVVRFKSPQPADIQAGTVAANSAYGRLMKGEVWEKVFADVTTDAKNIPNNGELGWRSLDLFDEKTKVELRSLKVGGITAPIQTNYGMQIFKLEGRGKDAPADQLVQMKADFVSAQVQPIIKRLEAKAVIVPSF